MLDKNELVLVIGGLKLLRQQIAIAYKSVKNQTDKDNLKAELDKIDNLLKKLS